MTKKKPSSRDQKALLIHDANLTTVEEQELQLLEEITDCLAQASCHVRRLQKLSEVR